MIKGIKLTIPLKSQKNFKNQFSFSKTKSQSPGRSQGLLFSYGSFCYLLAKDFSKKCVACLTLNENFTISFITYIVRSLMITRWSHYISQSDEFQRVRVSTSGTCYIYLHYYITTSAGYHSQSGKQIPLNGDHRKHGNRLMAPNSFLLNSHLSLSNYLPEICH